jgi:hypothetical protein
MKGMDGYGENRSYVQSLNVSAISATLLLDQQRSALSAVSFAACLTGTFSEHFPAFGPEISLP